MTQRNKIIFRTIFILFLSVGGILVAGGIFISRFVEKTLEAGLKSFHVTYSSFEISPLKGSVTVNNLKWIHRDDSLLKTPHELNLKSVTLSGINFYQFIRSRKVQISKISFADGNIHYNQNLKIDINHNQSNVDRPDLGEISVDLISLNNVNVKIFDDSVTEYSGTINLFLRNIALDDIKKAEDLAAYKLSSMELLITGLTIQKKQSMYRTRISQIYANSTELKIVIDSIAILPRYFGTPRHTFVFDKRNVKPR